MIRIKEIKVKEDLDDKGLIEFITKKFNIKQEIIDFRIYKKAIDARKKDNVHYVYTIDIKVKDETKITVGEKIEDTTAYPVIGVKRKSQYRPIVIGSGPAGLFAALTLVEHGISPIIIEQGKKIEERQKDVEEFWKTGKLNPYSNVQFGEGGAGTFSDGKLTTQIKNIYCRKVLEIFKDCNAPEEIMYISKPHIGTDKLREVIKNLREYIISKGGTFLFNEKVTDIEIENDKVKAVICSKRIETDSVILAIGHSSRDTFEMLLKTGFDMKQKPFAIGVRIEHKQDMIDKSQYGSITKLKLPAAEYKLFEHLDNGRTVYTFCMCPGGKVVASSSEAGYLVTNGMSYHKRDGENSNSAILVSVDPNDFDGNDPLAGVKLQREIERKAYKVSDSYKAPVQLLRDFLDNKASENFGNIKPTYMPGTVFANLNDILPKYITASLKEGILKFDKKLKGFASNEALLTGVETRSSSPVRIQRDENNMSNIIGVYPCGEGAGYAGGIMSSAVDGIKCAISLLQNDTY